MSDDSQDDDKQYEASQHKLDEARKKGDFARSTDLNTAAAYAGILIAGLAVGRDRHVIPPEGQVLAPLRAQRSVALHVA